MSLPTYQSAPPAYLLQSHMEMLTGEIRNVVWTGAEPVFSTDAAAAGYNPFNVKAMMYQTYLNGSPYAGLSAYDPSEQLDATGEALEEYKTVIDDWDPGADWVAAAEAVSTEADSLFLDATLIANEVSAYTNRTSARYARGIANVMSGLFMAGASEGSAVGISVALLGAERGYELEDFEQKLVQSQRDQWASFVNGQTAAYLNNASNKRQAQRDLYGLQAEFQTRWIVAGKEFVNEELAFAVKDSMFALDLLSSGSSVIGAVSGAPNLQPAPSKEMTMLSAGLGIVSAIAPLALAVL